MENKEVNINLGNRSVLININSKIYPLDVIYSAAYVFLDKSYIIIDGDPDNKIVIELRLKENSLDIKKDLEKLSMEFFNELLNYSFYKMQSEKTKELREALLKTALYIYEPEINQRTENIIEEDIINDKYIDWEEKYGNRTAK